MKDSYPPWTGLRAIAARTGCRELRATLTIYDASFVALAEALNSELLTGDARLARAIGPRCRIDS